jgi:hypothetical protein
VAAGVSFFIVGDLVGAWCCRAWLQLRPNLPVASVGILNIVITVASLLGLAGIALIALDRIVLSGVGNSGYAELLRCTPTLIDVVEIRRTPLLYLGYLTFSFGSASLALFLLKGEEVRRWPAALAQLSILSPVGYALLYSGRMPILLAIVQIAAVALVRVRQGRRPLPSGHHLLLKTVAVVVMFGIYSNAMWSSRRNFCSQMTGLVRELGVTGREQQSEQARILQKEQPQNPDSNNLPGAKGNGLPHAANPIRAIDLSKMIDDAKKASPGDAGRQFPPNAGAVVVMMKEGWHTSLRPYVLSAIDSGILSAGAASNLLSTNFYLSHGVYVLDLIWHARAQLTPHWGIYEIGILSPIFRIFFPQSGNLPSMAIELKAANIYGFFPTVWGGAYIDFGVVGAVIYILIWGFIAGWAAYGTSRSDLAMPPLLLSFVLASVLLSPIQGPLGIANSVLVSVSLIVVGMAVDFRNMGFRERSREPMSTPKRSARRNRL